LVNEVCASHSRAEESCSQHQTGSEPEECIRTIACFVWAQNKLGVAIYDCFMNEVAFCVIHEFKHAHEVTVVAPCFAVTIPAHTLNARCVLY